jgi:hypothetical protein
MDDPTVFTVGFLVAAAILFCLFLWIAGMRRP